MNRRNFNLSLQKSQSHKFKFASVCSILSFLKGSENKTLRSYAGGTIYSLFNSDWTVKFQYIINPVYHKLFNLYILL